MQKLALRSTDRRARARPARARIVASEPISSREIVDQHGFGRYREVKLTFLFDSPAGASPAPRATACWDVQTLALPKVAPDESLELLVDADDPSQVYPSEPWARPLVS